MSGAIQSKPNPLGGITEGVEIRAAGYAATAGAATWFVHVDLAASGIKLADIEFCERLITEAGVVSIPFSAFYARSPETGYVRFGFTKSEEVLGEALKRLARFRTMLD